MGEGAATAQRREIPASERLPCLQLAFGLMTAYMLEFTPFLNMFVFTKTHRAPPKVPARVIRRILIIIRINFTLALPIGENKTVSASGVPVSKNKVETPIQLCLITVEGEIIRY